MNRILALLFLSIVVYSCKTLGVQKEHFNQLELATIGFPSQDLENARFQTVALPNLNQKIRLTVELKPFKKPQFKQFQYANETQKKAIQVYYKDSLSGTSQYIVLSIKDKIALLEELNTTQNTKILDYLKITDKASVITQLSLVFPKVVQTKIQEATAVYLVQNTAKQYQIAIEVQGQTETISFDKGIVLAYENDAFCWKVSEKGVTQLVDISNKCTKGTYKQFDKATAKKEAFEFIKL